MTSIAVLNPLFEEHNIDPKIIIHLLSEGIHLEKLKLQVNEATDTGSLEVFTRIMQGERFLTLMIAARFE